MAPRRARQFSMPSPLSPATQGNYRSPAWQGRIELYARNYFTPTEYENAKRVGIKFLPQEARLIAGQFATSAEHRGKVQRFVGSAYVYDLAYALLRDLRVSVETIVRQPDTFTQGGKDIIQDLVNNIRGWRFVHVVAGGGPAVAGTVTIGNNTFLPNRARRVEADVQMRRLAPQQEIALRNRGWINIGGDNYTIERVPHTMTAPGPFHQAPGGWAPRGGGNNGGELYPYQTNANGEYAVESILNQLIELCNSDMIRTGYFTIQSRQNVFWPLDLENRTTGQGQLGGANINNARVFANEGLLLESLVQNNNALLPGNGAATKTALGGNIDYGARMAQELMRDLRDSEFPNVIRGITVPASQSGMGRNANAGVIEYEKLMQTQNELLGGISKWAETGLGLLTLGGVDFADYRRGDVPVDGDWSNVLGNRPAALKYAEYNYAGNACGPGYTKLFYTADPNDPKAKRAEQWISDGLGRKVPNPLARVGVCAPTMGAQMPLPGTGTDVYTDMEYPVVHRMAAQKRAKRKPAAKRKTKK